MEIVRCELFRVTRNANAEKSEEDADDLLALIESELQERRFAPIVRLEVMPGMDPAHRGRLAAELGLDEAQDVFEVDGDARRCATCFEIAALPRPELKDPPHHPIDHPLLQTERSIFHIIRDAGSILLQHPYEAFASSLERFLKEAAEDPKVRAIKMTLYRTASESSIIEHLIAAAPQRQAGGGGRRAQGALRRGGQHPARRAAWRRPASTSPTASSGLKTHAKVILVVRQDYNGLQRYVHVGTGNYHPVTSRLYADLGLLTADETIGTDATELFNYLTTGFTPKRRLPQAARRAQEPQGGAAREDPPRDPRSTPRAGGGLIRFKMNALEDADIARALYEASRAGRARRPDRARLLPRAPRPAGPLGDDPGDLHRRALPRARPHLLLPQRRRRGVLHRLRRRDEAQPGVPRRGPRAGGVAGAARRAQGAARRPVERPAQRLGDARRRHLRPAPAAGQAARREPGSQETLIRLAEKRLKTATRLRKRTSLTPGQAEPALEPMPSFLLPAGLERRRPARAAGAARRRSSAGAPRHEPPHLPRHLRLAPAPGGLVARARRRTARAAGCACARSAAGRRSPTSAGPAVRFARELPAGALRDAARAGARPARAARRSPRPSVDRDPDRRAAPRRARDDAARARETTLVGPPGDDAGAAAAPACSTVPAGPRAAAVRALCAAWPDCEPAPADRVAAAARAARARRRATTRARSGSRSTGALPARDAARALLLHLLGTLEANLPGVRADLDPEFLHDLRVAVRRTRSALGQIKGVLPPATARALRPRVRLAAGGDRARARPGRLRARSSPRSARCCRRAAAPQPRPARRACSSAGGASAHAELARALDAPRFARLLADWRAFLLQPTPEAPARRPERAAARAPQRGRGAHRQAATGARCARARAIGDASPAADLHELRKTCKKLRYLVEFFHSLLDREAADAAIESLKGLQDTLGRLPGPPGPGRRAARVRPRTGAGGQGAAAGLPRAGDARRAAARAAGAGARRVRRRFGAFSRRSGRKQLEAAARQPRRKPAPRPRPTPRHGREVRHG